MLITDILTDCLIRFRQTKILKSVSSPSTENEDRYISEIFFSLFSFSKLLVKAVTHVSLKCHTTYMPYYLQSVHQNHRTVIVGETYILKGNIFNGVQNNFEHLGQI